MHDIVVLYTLLIYRLAAKSLSELVLKLFHACRWRKLF